MNLQFNSNSPEGTAEVAEKILSACKNHKIFAIYGDLGAGKTTLIQALCACLKVSDLVKSPTFSIVNEYDFPDGRVYHFDFYRLKYPEEALDIGLEEYLDAETYCFMEWPEIVENWLPEDRVEIRIDSGEDSERVFKVSFELKA